MPFFTFHGLPEQAVEDYYKELPKIASLIGADQDNIIFITDTHKILNSSAQRTAFISVEWIKREDKELLLVEHIRNFFAPYADRTLVFFTDVNGKLYVNGQKK